MRRVLGFCVLSIASLVGCQGIGGYSAQSVTRVPPIGTGTYAMPGGGTYYGNAAPAPGTAMMTSGATPVADAGFAAGNYATNNLQPATSTDQYEMPSTSAVGSGVSTASATGAIGGRDLQWQR